MTKEKLVKDISLRCGINQEVCGEVITTLADSIRDALAIGEEITLINIGTFKTKERKPRGGRDPITGEITVFPERRIVSFTVSNTLKEAVK